MPDAKATLALVGEDQTAAAFRSALGNVESFAAQAKGLLEGAFALGGAGIAVDFVKSITGLSDELVKGAERAGIAQQQFNNLAAAFNEADISTESLSKGFKFLEVNISKAAAGNKTMAAAFNELGLSAKELKQLAPEVQMEAFAEAVSRVSDPTDRARLGAETMGRAFLELEPKLIAGAEALDKLAASANGLDAATTENLAKFNKELNQTGMFLKGWAAFSLNGLFNFFGGLKDVFSPDLDERIKRIKTALASPDNFDAATVERMMKQLALLQAQADALANKPATANVEAALEEQGKGKMEAIKTMLAEIDKNWTEITDRWAKKRSEQLDQEDRETQTIGDKRIEFERKVLDLLKIEGEQMSKGRITLGDAFNRLNQASDINATKMMMRENEQAIKESLKETEKDWHNSYADIGQDSKLATELMRVDFEKTKSNAAQAAQGIEDAFATFLVNPFQGGLKKMLASWVQTIDQMVAKAAAQSIFKSLFGDTVGGLGGIFENFLGGGSSTAVTFDSQSDISNALDGHATGGSWKVGGAGGTDSQLVRFMATPGERVTVQTPAQQAGGGVTVNNYNNIDARSDATQIAQMIAQSTRYAIQQSTAQVVNMVKRGAFTNT